MEPRVSLSQPTRQDVQNLAGWLTNPELRRHWYGTGDHGEPIHAGYSPYRLLKGSSEEWIRTFQSDERKYYSIYDSTEGHVGEAQLAIDWPLHEAQLFVLIGRPDLWFHHIGTNAMYRLLEFTFGKFKLHRAWVDVPDYNLHAIHMCERLGFVLEGHLRSTHLKDGEWHDSRIMGLLESEFSLESSDLQSQLGDRTV